jgi:predicted RNA binding protein YcfA (HicA-like mRNA interferase family)
MPELPVISGDQCVLALERVGYNVARIRGSHIRMRCPGRKPVTVSRHRELDRGTLKAILRTAGLTIEEFINLL